MVLGESLKCCKFVKNHFFSIKLCYAHLQFVCNILAKYYNDTLKALGGDDFTKYAPLSNMCIDRKLDKFKML